MKYLSLFTGIGGFEYGIANADPHAECIGYSEIDGPAIITYEEHYEHHNYGDITTINPAELPDFDLVVGGFPCQAFSVAGLRRGFTEARGTLFFDVARILQHKRPRHLVLENVKGLLSHDGGKTLQTIARILTDLGYRIEWQVLNSKDFGVPQNRERIYIVGHLGDDGCGQVFPLTAADGQTAAIGYRPDGLTGINIDTRTKAGYRETEIANAINSSYSTGITGGHSQRTAIKQTAGTINRGSFKETNDQALTIDKSYHKGPDNHGQRPMVLDASHPSRVRRLTPKECERLQGFPDNWTVGSDTQRYKQCGNAVTTKVVEAVYRQLMTVCNLQAESQTECIPKQQPIPASI